MKHLPNILLVALLTTPVMHSSMTDIVTGYRKLASRALQKHNYTLAASYYLNALRAFPNDTLLHWEYGTTLKELGNLEEAIIHFQRAIDLDSNNFSARFSLANALTLMEQPEKALEHYAIVAKEFPSVAQVLYNYGFALKKIGAISQALELYKNVLALEPEYQHAHFSGALAYLTVGDFEHGWPEYEWRNTISPQKKEFFSDKMRWDGTQDLTDKRLLLIAEQGLGDTFQFIRYAQLIKSQYNCTIICQVQSALISILKACPYIDILINYKESLTECQFDYYNFLMSMPLACNTTINTIPTPIPYINPNKNLINQWHTRLDLDTRFKIGICWQGNTQYIAPELQRTVAAKSITPEHFAPLAALQEVSLYSLQKVDNQYTPAPVSFPLYSFDADFDQTHGRFMDTAAVMKNLDLIVTIDTSIAHLAGALGVPVWVLLPYPADWRWMLERTDSPWYPTMRLFRQKTRGDWELVMQEVVETLKKHITQL